MNRLCDAVSIIILESVPYNSSKHLGFGMRDEKGMKEKNEFTIGWIRTERG